VPKPHGVIEVVLGIPGDEAALKNSKVVWSIAAALDKLNKSSGLSGSPLYRELTLQAVAQEAGFDPAQVDDAIRAFGSVETDPNRQQLAHSYFETYPSPHVPETSATLDARLGHRPLSADQTQSFRDKMSELRNRVNELDELIASNIKMIKDVDARSQEGIHLASAKANEADQHAMDADNRAQAAQQTASQLAIRLNTVEQVVVDSDDYQTADQAEIHFRPGQGVLGRRARDVLDGMSAPLKQQSGYIIEVQGFSSGYGLTAIENSRRVAESVVRYLFVDDDIPLYRIHLIGLGNARIQADAKDKPCVDALMVEVKVMKNATQHGSLSAGMLFEPNKTKR
jgi:outer membrane protein OmpA-like peptidoglycan-associated protein